MLFFSIGAPKLIIIGASLIVIVSYFFSLLARRTNIPSVLLLIALGVGISYTFKYFHLPEYDIMPALEVLGIVGLIMIVLEAALDLKLEKEKIGLIVKSLLIALLGVLINALLTAYIIQYVLGNLDFWVALIYAIPISIMSSAIIIPSVKNLDEKKKEFMIYEGTFSDIVGIIFFYSLLANIEAESPLDVGVSVSGNILMTIIISFIISYLMLFLLQKIKTRIKLFFLIAVLILFYSIGKVMHLSSLLIILVFGLILSNRQIFVRGFLKKIIKNDELTGVFKDFKTITLESSFVVRTFFFVVFGMSIVLSSLLNMQVVVVSVLALVILYASRYLLLRIFVGKNIVPQLFLAPRGLISILLFFSIPEEFIITDFESGTLLFVIIATSLIMAWALIAHRKKSEALHAKEITPIEPIPDEKNQTVEWDLTQDAAAEENK